MYRIVHEGAARRLIPRSDAPVRGQGRLWTHWCDGTIRKREGRDTVSRSGARYTRFFQETHDTEIANLRLCYGIMCSFRCVLHTDSSASLKLVYRLYRKDTDRAWDSASDAAGASGASDAGNTTKQDSREYFHNLVFCLRRAATEDTSGAGSGSQPVRSCRTKLHFRRSWRTSRQCAALTSNSGPLQHA